MNKNTIKILTLLILLQFSSNALSIDIFGPQGFQGLIAKYKAGDLEIIPVLLKHMGDVKEILPKHVILNFLDIKYGENTRDEAFIKAQNDLKEKYLKYSLKQNTPTPDILSDIVSGYLKKYRLVKTLDAKLPVIELRKLGNDRLAVGLAETGIIQIWNLKENKIVAVLDGRNNGYISRLNLLKLEDNKLAVGLSNGDIQIWDLGTYKLIKTIRTGATYISSLLKLDGNRLAAGISDGCIQIWDLGTYKLIKTIRTGATYISLLLKLDDNKLAVEVNDDVQIWDLDSDQLVKTICTGLIGISSLFRLDGNRLAVGIRDGIIQIWDLNKYQLIKTIVADELPKKLFAYFTSKLDRSYSTKLDNGRIASIRHDNRVLIWDSNTYEPIVFIDIGRFGTFAGIPESLGGSALALPILYGVGQKTGEIQIWDEELDIADSPSNSVVDKLNIDNHNQKLKKEAGKVDVELSAKAKQLENSNTIFRFLANLFGSDAPPKLTIAG